DQGGNPASSNAMELSGLHKSGQEIPLEISFGEFTKNGERFFTGIARDITERKRIEAELRRSLDFDEAVMTNMGEGLYTVDHEGRVTYVNPAAEQLLGWTS